MKSTKNLVPSLKELEEKRVDNIQYLITYTFEELEQLKNNLYHRIGVLEEEGSKDSIEFIKERLSQVHEAIDVKKGNEEQAWDYLT